ncbi:hypothetical protein SMD22_00755 (plasmid) [Brevibacillus halotolerans]|nr:hypothetical protein SMD22_00755 [Brevibacillus halotolerans]
MSVNYYFKDVKAKESLIQLEQALKTVTNVDMLFINKVKFPSIEDIFSTHEIELIHIGQSACGTLLLKRNECFYKTITEMKQFYKRNQDRLIIVAEDGIEYSWDEFEREILSQPPRSGYGYHRDKDGYVWESREYF